jgi:N-acetylglucosamine kinase-like BadF-type ATPase
MKQYVAGWDGGGTKTVCELRSLDGKETLRLFSGPLNLNGTAKGQAAATVRDLLEQMSALPGGLEECRMLCIGTAGISNPNTASWLNNELKKSGYKGAVYFTGDQQTALYGALGGPGGAVIIAGTGSICYGESLDGRKARTGGWGSLMDDEGSGYAIGRDILAAVVRSEDGRAPRTCMKEAVFRHFNVDDINGLIGKIYAPDVGKKEIAALAPILEDALDKNDAAAIKICDKATTELALLVRPVVEKLGLQNARLAMAGSILTKCLQIREGTVKKVTAVFPDISCVLPMQDAAAGAALMALKALSEFDKR